LGEKGVASFRSVLYFANKRIVNKCNDLAVIAACWLDSFLEKVLFLHSYPGINHVVVMQDKHKVTLYLPPDLHRQLKIRSAVELEAMSAIAERAIEFYLTHSDIVDEIETFHGQSHRIYTCPECVSSLILREGEMVSLREQSGLLPDNDLSLVDAQGCADAGQQGEEELVPC